MKCLLNFNLVFELNFDFLMRDFCIDFMIFSLFFFDFKLFHIKKAFS